MISLHISRSVASLFSRNSSPRCKSNVCFSVSLLYFSTSTEAQSVTAPAVNLHKYNFSPQVVSRVASVVARSKNPERLNSMLSFLEESGFSNTHLEKLMKSKPKLLTWNIEAIIKPKIKIFQDLGFSAHEIADIISSNPTVLGRSLSNRIIPSLSVLKSVVGSNADVTKLLRTSSWFLITDLEKTMAPNVEFLKSCGIPMKDIIRQMSYSSRFIFRKPETIRKSVDRAEEMGINRSSNLLIYAVAAVSSLSNEGWELKLKAFRDSGFLEDEILRMFRTAPKVFSVSDEKLKNVTKFLLSTGRYSTSCIARHPASLMHSIETRYKPRLHAIEILHKKKLIKDWPSLYAICHMPNTKFYGKYVYPYLNEISDIHMEVHSLVKDS